MKTLSMNFLLNWKTSLGGVLAALPPAVTAAGFTLTPAQAHWLALCQGLGALLIGLAAKDSSTHSTPDQVRQSGSEAAASGTHPPVKAA